MKGLSGSNKDYDDLDDQDYSLPSTPICEPVPAEEVDKRIKQFVPGSEEAKEMLAVLKNECGVDRLLAIEVDHCP